jgi:hypothetical protein
MSKQRQIGKRTQDQRQGRHHLSPPGDSRKPRFKVQRKNSYDEFDVRHAGRKRWLPVYDNSGKLGFTLDFQQATDLYWQMQSNWTCQTYRIVERR